MDLLKVAGEVGGFVGIGIGWMLSDWVEKKFEIGTGWIYYSAFLLVGAAIGAALFGVPAATTPG